MNLDDLTYKEIKHIQSLLKEPEEVSHPYKIGRNYFIRTVTHHLTGELTKVTPKELVLINAAWIADDGRFHDALKIGQFNEVEPFPPNLDVIVGRGSIIDCVEWCHKLPREQK